MADAFEDLERAVAAVRTQRARETGRIDEIADGIREAHGKLTELIAARELAESRLDAIRKLVDNFLAGYGDSKLPMFKVAQDLANSIRKRLDGEANSS